MKHAKRKHKKAEIRKHREMVHEYAMDKLIEGKVSPDYVHERFLKLKEVRK